MINRPQPRMLTLQNVFYALTVLLLGAGITQLTIPLVVVILGYWTMAFRSKLLLSYPVF